MIFTITALNKDLDMYTVISDTNEKKNVTSLQIVSVMCNGYMFTNAKLTNKGFSVVTTKGTRYIQVKMNKDMQIIVQNKMRMLAALEESKKKQMSNALNNTVKTSNITNTSKTQQIGRPPVESKQYAPENINIKQKITGNKTSITKIIFRGKHYYGVKDICEKFNSDPKVFLERYEKGYSTEECLGLVPLRSESELIKFKQANQKAMLSMAINRGEY